MLVHQRVCPTLPRTNAEVGWKYSWKMLEIPENPPIDFRPPPTCTHPAAARLHPGAPCWNRSGNKWSTWKADESWTVKIQDSSDTSSVNPSPFFRAIPKKKPGGPRPQLLTCRPWEPVCISLHIMRRNCSRHQLSRSWP